MNSSLALTTQTTFPLGVLNLARSFREAAERAKPAPGSGRHGAAFVVSLPAYFLAGRAIELALKALLLAHGSSMDDLRRNPKKRNKGGHGLKSLLDLVNGKNLAPALDLSERDMALLELLDLTYSDKRFEYIEEGESARLMSVPSFPDLLRLVDHVLSMVRPACEIRAFGRANENQVLFLGVPLRSGSRSSA